MNQEEQNFIEQIQQKYGKKFLFNILFKDQQILDYLQARGLYDFLIKIDSSDLREALKHKQLSGDNDFAIKRYANNQNKLHVNVLDLTIDQLVRRNWDLRLIRHQQYISHFKPRGRNGGQKFNTFSLKRHRQLGMNLVQAEPQNYIVGEKSGHYNHSREIQMQYGIYEDNKSIQSDNEQYEDDDQFIDDRSSEELSQQSDELKIKRKKQRKNEKKQLKKNRNCLKKHLIDSQQEELYNQVVQSPVGSNLQEFNEGNQMEISDSKLSKSLQKQTKNQHNNNTKPLHKNRSKFTIQSDDQQ